MNVQASVMMMIPSTLLTVLCIAVSVAAVALDSSGSLPVPRRSDLLHRMHSSEQHKSLVSGVPLECACMNTSLCQPLRTPLPEKEIFAFQVDATNWPFYDWSRLTSVVLYDGIDPALVCMAHARNVRIIWATGFSASQLLNVSATTALVDEMVTKVTSSYADGINFDFEDPVAEGSAEEAALTSLVATMRTKLKAAVPAASMTFDVAWSSSNIDGRSYNYTAIAAACDFVVIMDYDTRSQVFSGPPCFAGPNSPAETLFTGVESFLTLGIHASKLVLGVPWYGYVYNCINTPANADIGCQIASVPFRGVPCSDAAGTQWPFYRIQSFVRNASTPLVSSVVVNTSMADDGSFATVRYNSSSGGAHLVGISQLYWDVPATLKEKYRAAKELKLRGVSMWNADSLSNDAVGPAADDTREMWSALDAFVVL